MDFLKKRKQCSDEEMQRKIANLPPELQAQFLWATDMLLQKESALFLEIIQDSRNEINDISQEIRSDKSTFRSNAHKLDKYSDGHSAKSATDKLNEFVEKRQKTKKNMNFNFQPDQEKEAVENYLKAVGRHKDDESSSKTDIPSYARPATSGYSSRPGTAFKIRMEETPSSNYVDSSNDFDRIVVDPTVNKQQEELIQRMKEQDSQAVSERERQKKILEKKKVDRQNKGIDSAGVRAADMIDQSRGVDEKQIQNKVQQEKTIQERLEKMKVNKNVSPINERSATMLATNPTQSKNSLFEESRKELSIRPQTGESKSPSRSPSKMPESIELRTPIKSGWGESESSRNVASMFEVNEQYPQQEVEKKKHKNKKNRSKNTSESVSGYENSIEIENL